MLLLASLVRDQDHCLLLQYLNKRRIWQTVRDKFLIFELNKIFKKTGPENLYWSQHISYEALIPNLSALFQVHIMNAILKRKQLSHWNEQWDIRTDWRRYWAITEIHCNPFYSNRNLAPPEENAELKTTFLNFKFKKSKEFRKFMSLSEKYRSHF